MDVRTKIVKGVILLKFQRRKKWHFMLNMNLLLKTSRNASTAKAILMKRAKISSVDLNKTRKREKSQTRAKIV